MNSVFQKRVVSQMNLKEVFVVNIVHTILYVSVYPVTKDMKGSEKKCEGLNAIAGVFRAV